MEEGAHTLFFAGKMSDESQIEYYLVVDPLQHQSNRRHHGGLEFARQNSEMLQRLFSKNREEVRAASASYMGRPRDLLEFILVAGSWLYFQEKELKDDARSLAVSSMIFAGDALMRGEPSKSGHQMRSSERAVAFFRESLETADKRLLLNAFTFSQPTKGFPLRAKKTRHIAYRSMLMSKPGNMRASYRQDYCHPSPSPDSTLCGCGEWLQRQAPATIDAKLDRLTSFLYEMRCSVVHDGHRVLFCHTETPPTDYTHWSMTVVDVYANTRSGAMTLYDSSISRVVLERIFVSALWNAFRDGRPHKSPTILRG